jgi:DNA-damage-inducible protein D
MVDLGTGIRPEGLPPAKDVKKVERRLTSDEKKALENLDKLEGA